MKKLTILLALLITTVFLSAQVEREYVVLEIGTGTWCVWCPGAATGADELVENGHDVAVIENHNGDPYANIYSNTRNSYNGVSGYPTAMFDGVEENGGGAQCPNPTGKYAEYLPIYNLRKGIQSPYTIDMMGFNNGLNYDVTITINKVASVSTSNTVVHLVLTESHISDTWFCMTECNFVNRLMVPNQNGTNLNLQNDQMVLNLSFTIDASWDIDHCELTAFIQDNSSHEIHQALMKPLTELDPPPVSANFEADETMVCEGSTVTYTDLSDGYVTSWNWTFEGGTPATSNEQNPTVVYNTEGDYDVTLYVSDGSTNDEMTKSDYISTSAIAPNTPNQPEGENQLCKNPPNQDYTATGAPNAVYYDWEIDPSTAGFIINDGSQNITINYPNAYVGSAFLKVKAINGCGESDFSEELEITISEAPALFDVTGGGAFCEEGSGVDIALSGSEVGIDYELYLEDTPTGNIITGTGDPITFTGIMDEGFYTIVGGDSETGCSVAMNNTAEVVVVPKPVAFNITGGGDYCVGTSGIEVGLDGSEADVTYELYLDGAATGITALGTGDVISFGNVEGEGEYTAMATESINSCTNEMAGNTAVGIIYMPEIPNEPLGPDYIDILYNESTEFTTEGSANSESYEWFMDPDEAGDLEVISVNASEVTWFNGFEGLVTIKVRGVNECGESDWSAAHEVMVYNSVGIDTPDANVNLTVSPNPTTGQFVLKVNSKKEEVCSIKITNAVHKVVYSNNDVQINGSYSENINLGNASNGMYFVTLKTNDYTVTKKLVIRK